MALRSEFSLGHSEFNDFLFAFVGEEKDGVELTVLSVLARLDLDPWAEAARLSKLTREAATNALAAAILSLPDGDLTEADTRSIAVRLVDRLPKHGSSTAKSSSAKSSPSKLSSATSSPDSNASDKKPIPEIRKWLSLIGLALTVFLVLLRLFGD